jgi:hypothetical protein
MSDEPYQPDTNPHTLRDRIAAAIEECPMPIDGQEWSELLADAVIAELDLTPENSYGTTYPNVPIKDVTYVRYITEWRAEN